MSSLLKIDNMSVSFATPRGNLRAVNDVTIELLKGESLGVVGESGSGKTVLSRATMGLLPGTATRTGTITYNGQVISDLPKDEVRELWGTGMAMIFQDPMTALNPVRRIGAQLTESLTVRLGMDKKAAKQKAIELLMRVRIPDPESMLRKFPYQLSGGMRQRIMIAIAVSCEPQLLFADEPTTALDVTIQQQILALVMQERRKRNMSMLWITHDLGVVANLVDRVIVMYAGRIVEVGSVKDVFTNPQHPYTAGLLASLPKASDKNRTRLVSIPGIPPKPWTVGQSCAFSPRCSRADEQCRTNLPVLATNTHTEAACFHLMGENA